MAVPKPQMRVQLGRWRNSWSSMSDWSVTLSFWHKKMIVCRHRTGNQTRTFNTDVAFLKCCAWRMQQTKCCT